MPVVSGANTNVILALTCAMPEVNNAGVVLITPIPLLNNVALFASFENDLVYRVDNELDPIGPVTYNGVMPVVGGANVKGILPVTGGVLVKTDIEAAGVASLVYNVAKPWIAGDVYKSWGVIYGNF